MKKILFIFGTRPEAIKVAPVIKKLSVEKKYFEVKVCITAQHRYLLDQVLDLFSINSDYDLNIMEENQTLSDITTKTLIKLDNVLKKEKPDLVLVHGDTTTTLASTLASFYHKIPVGHIESGLRTYDKFNPYPEEMNRLLVDMMANLHFAPTLRAKKCLIKENINPKNIFITGNTVIDALNFVLKKKHIFSNYILKQLFNKKKLLNKYRIILLTAHRRENFGIPIKNICYAVNEIVKNYPDVLFIYPVHPNPNITQPVKKILGNTERVYLTQPLDYFDLVNVMNKSYFILTDSGGLQEEAPSLGKPVLVLRRLTERPEGIIAGTVRLAGVEKSNIVKLVSLLLTDKKEYNKMSKAINPYGDGKASERITESIKYYFGFTTKRPADFMSTKS
jgi:UDP-N-acetylglucosamine 2-epimerase (non-hydrolysing)